MNLSNPVDLIIVNDKSQILLVKRAEEELGLKGTWSIPGGGTEKSENFETALHREIKEELNCEIKWLKFFKSYYLEISSEHAARAVYFYGEIQGDIKINKELLEYKWFNFDDLQKLDFAFNQKEIISEFYEFQKTQRS